MNNFKTLFISACIVIVSLTVQAEPLWYRATAVSAKPNSYKNWTTWISVDIPVIINFDTKHIEIQSESAQIFDYIGFSVERTDDCTIYGSLATDINYQVMYLELYLYDSNLWILKITYKDLEYKYVIDAYKK